MFCTHCGKPSEHGDMFCTHCGKGLSEAVGKTGAGQADPFGVPVAEMNLKKGRYVIFANVVVGLQCFCGYLPLLLWAFLDVNAFMQVQTKLLMILLGICVGFLSLLFPFLVKYLMFKAKGHKPKLFVGRIFEVGSNEPIARNTYILCEVLGLIPFVVVTVLAVVFWFSPLVIAWLIVCTGNVVANVPIYVGLLRQKASSKLRFAQGVLFVYGE